MAPIPAYGPILMESYTIAAIRQQILIPNQLNQKPNQRDIPRIGSKAGI